MMTTGLVGQVDGSLRAEGIERRALRADDVDVRVLFCGVCQTDVHALRAHAASVTAGAVLVPGHEFVGEVLEVGSAVTAVAIGDLVAVGNIVDSCGACAMCLQGQENFCAEFPTLTYGGTDRVDGSTTLGGFSGRYVVRDRFVYRLPAELEPASAAPLMCAGVTVWEPLQAENVGPGTRVGVVGIGGLGHLAVRLARALGAEVTAFTTSASKADDARRLGAHAVVASTDGTAMAAVRASLDVIIDTVSVEHDVAPYLEALALDGVLFSLGHLGSMTIDTMNLLVGRKRLASAGSGGRRSTAELLDFCARHGVTADVEIVDAGDLNVAIERLARNDVRYRFVADLRELSI